MMLKVLQIRKEGPTFIYLLNKLDNGPSGSGDRLGNAHIVLIAAFVNVSSFSHRVFNIPLDALDKRSLTSHWIKSLKGLQKSRPF
jgi:hypothetical protein